MIIGKIRENDENMVNFVIEELMKQPYSMMSKTKTPLPYHPGTHSNIVHKIVEYDAAELLEKVLGLVRNEKLNAKLFTINEQMSETLEKLYEDYLVMPQVGPNQKVVRGDRPIHIGKVCYFIYASILLQLVSLKLAVRNSSLKVLEYLKTLPQFESMLTSVNSFNEKPMDIVREKADTETKQKMIQILTSVVHVVIVETDSQPELMLSSNPESELIESPQGKFIQLR